MTLAIKFNKDKLARSAANLTELLSEQQGLPGAVQRILSALVTSGFDMQRVAAYLAPGRQFDHKSASLFIGDELKAAAAECADLQTQQAIDGIVTMIKSEDPSGLLNITKDSVKKSSMPFMAKFAAMEVVDSIEVKEAI